MPRTAEVVFVGSAQDLIRAAKEAEAAVAASEKGITGSNVRMGASAKKAAAETEQAHAKVKTSFASLGHSAVLAGGAILGVGAAIEGIKHSANTLGEVAKQTLTLHNVTGLSVQSASAYAAVAQAQGLNARQLNQAFGTLAKNVQAVDNAHQGLTKSAKTQENAFRLLHVPLQDVYKAHGDMNKLLPVVTAAFERMPGGIQKAAAGMALFGRGWQTLVPLMHTGLLGLKEQLDVAEKMGATLEGKTVKNLKEFQRAQEESKYATLGLQLAIGQYLAPVLTKLIVGLAGVIHSIRDAVKWLEKHREVALALAGAIGGTLAIALSVFAYSKATAFVNATKDMVKGLEALAARMGITAAAVTTADGEIVAANSAAGVSFGALATGAVAAMAKIGAAVAVAVLAIKGLEGLIKKVTGEASSVGELLGGGQPGESGREGEAQMERFKKRYGSAFPAPNARELATGQSKSHIQGGIMAFFMSKGLSAAQAAGIVGNIEQESSTNPNAPGGGLFQDIGSRAASGKGSTLHQIEAAWRELNTSERGALEAIRHAKTPEQAARIFSEQFERPGKPMLSNRERYAREAYRAHPQRSVADYELAAERVEETHRTARHAAKRLKHPAEAYVSPLANPQITREDMGLDFTAHPGEAIKAIGTGVIDKILKNWYKGQSLIEEKLTSGAHKGQYVYYAEQLNPNVREGQGVRAGQRVATVASSGTGLELGFGAGGGVTLAHLRNEFKDHPGNDPTQASRAFRAFLASIGKGGSPLGAATGEFVSNTKADEKAAKEHAAAVKKHAEVVAAAQKKLAEQVTRWREAFSSLTEKMAELASSATQAWNTIQSKAISAAHASAIKGIEGGPVAAEIKADEATDKRLARERTEAANTKALKEARATGDKTKIREAEEAITDFARAQDEERKREAVEAAKKAADEQEETALERLAKETEAYEASLNRQLAALTKLLGESRISYRAYAADVTAIMAGTGVIYKPEKGVEAAVAGGSGKPPPAHPVEGSYTTGPNGERIYHPPGYGAGTGGVASALAPTVNINGPVSMGSPQDSERLVSRLAFRLKHG